jgi:flagellar hook-basal body complex protein FliE
VSETCTVVTTLLDHRAAPAGQVRDTYLTRWSASETTFGEDKATIAGAGNRTSGPVLRSGSPRLAIQEAWAWLTATQLVRASAAAALRSGHAAARALRRRNQQEAAADEESFTAALRQAIRSMASTQVTASSSLHALAAAADASARAALHTLNVPGRQRHSPRMTPSAPEGKRNAGLSQARIQLIIWQGYEDRWDLLGTPTSEVPVLLPGWLRQRAQEERVGLPPGHPWNKALPQW